jgi:hypothetical protein
MTDSKLKEALERIVVAFDDNRLGEVVTIARAALEDQGEGPTAACLRCEDWRKMGLSSYCPSHEPKGCLTTGD